MYLCRLWKMLRTMVVCVRDVALDVDWPIDVVVVVAVLFWVCTSYGPTTPKMHIK